ncbi:MAG: hypothetical protein M3459_00855 [Actinomycetota bacterium]|nr:hypothetical protein [Actinomycetota bacterium]
MNVDPDQLSFVARPEVVVEYRPWDWLCAGDETVPYRGGFCAYVRGLARGVGFGCCADAALIDLGRDLGCAVDESAGDAPLTADGQVLAAAQRLERRALAAFLRDHAREAVLATDAH